MGLRIFPALQYIEYYLKKEDRHSLHAPFAYRLYQGLKDYRSRCRHQFPEIEQRRKAFLMNDAAVRVDDFGAGSHAFSSPDRKIKDIVRHSCSSQKHSLLYQYFCSLTPAQTVIELGTCLGLTSSYLAEAARGTLYTFEGAEELAHLAQKNIRNYKNIRLIIGDISETLPNFLRQRKRIDFAFIDANHTYAHTLSYYDQIRDWVHEESVVVIGDIHWSREMNRAWKEIIASDKVRLSLDFYESGVLFFKEGIEKKHHVLHY